MVIEKLSKEKITVSFSGAVGKKGLNNIKEFIEDLELNKSPKKKATPKAVVNKLSREINKSAWEKFKKERGIA